MARTTSAIVLAAGRGTRMRAETGHPLSGPQASAAERGAKAMMPVGRPFLDYVLHSLAEAGITRVCLVVGPSSADIVTRYTRDVVPSRFALDVVLQPEPRGTADAVLRAEGFAGGATFLVVNGDNLYPAASLAALASLGAPGLVGYQRDALVREGNVDAARIARYALIGVGPDATLRRIVEKPDPATAASMGRDALVSMNSWSFDARIFDACRRVRPSPRGELELQDAVAYAIGALGAAFRVIPWSGGVLDLASRADVGPVAERLRGVEVRL